MRIQKKSLEQLIKSYNSGNILYRFQIGGNVRIGQSSKGYLRLSQHFRGSYYYSKVSGKMHDDLDSFKIDLRATSGKQLNVSYIDSAYFGLGKDKYNAFLSYFRPITGNSLYQYNNVDQSPTYQLDIGELLYTYYESESCSKYSNQCGSQHNIAEIAFNKGNAVVGKRIFIVQERGGTSPGEAASVLNNPIRNVQKIEEDLRNNLQITGGDLKPELANFLRNMIINGVVGSQSLNNFKKQFQHEIEQCVDELISTFKNNLKKTGIFTKCSGPIDKGVIAPDIRGNDKINKLMNLKSFLQKGGAISDLEGELGLVSIKYTLDKKTVEAINNMDKMLINEGQTSTTFNGTQVEEDFRQKLVALRFIDVWYHMRERIGSQLTGSESVFHTRPTRMKYSESEGGHELPEYAFVFNTNPDIRKASMREEFERTMTYIPDDGDSYYHILMSIADSENNLQFIRKMPLEKRQKGVRRTQYAVYIYEDLPSGVNSALPGADLPVHGAYAMSGDETWIQSGLNDTIDLSNLTDY